MPISIVMPCYNEEKIIEQVVNLYYGEIISKEKGSEFIVIDDCSTDKTGTILEGLKNKFPGLRIVKTPSHGGHGKAIRLGYELAGKQYVFQIDSDNQFEVKDFWRLYALRDKYDFMLGFRAQRQDPIYRIVLSLIVRFADLILFGVWIKDANCPFRIMKKELLDDMLKIIDARAVAPNIMLSVLTKKRKINMVEICTKHYPRQAGAGLVSKWSLFKLCSKGLIQLVVLRLRLGKAIIMTAPPTSDN